jgi:hypothetical protein
MDDGQGDVASGHGAEWITLGETARRLGVTRAAVYGRIERRTLTTRPKGNRGLEVLWPPPQHHPNGKGDVTQTVAGDSADVTRDVKGDAAALLDDFRERLTKAEGEAAQLRHEVMDLRVNLAKAQEQVAAARAVAIADVATAQAQVVAQEKLIAQLEELLADARRPWWRRLLVS